MTGSVRLATITINYAEVDWQERFEILQDLIIQFPRRKINFTIASLALAAVRTVLVKLYGFATNWV